MSLGSQDIEEARQARLDAERYEGEGTDQFVDEQREAYERGEDEYLEWRGSGELLDCGCPAQVVDDENHHQEGCQWGTGPVRELETATLTAAEIGQAIASARQRIHLALDNQVHRWIATAALDRAEAELGARLSGKRAPTFTHAQFHSACRRERGSYYEPPF